MRSLLYRIQTKEARTPTRRLWTVLKCLVSPKTRWTVAPHRLVQTCYLRQLHRPFRIRQQRLCERRTRKEVSVKASWSQAIFCTRARSVRSGPKVIPIVSLAIFLVSWEPSGVLCRCLRNRLGRSERKNAMKNLKLLPKMQPTARVRLQVRQGI